MNRVCGNLSVISMVLALAACGSEAAESDENMDIEWTAPMDARVGSLNQTSSEGLGEALEGDFGEEESLSDPELLATLTTELGNTISFYAFGSSVLLTEAGEAISYPVMDSLRAEATGGRNLLELWDMLSLSSVEGPLPAPAALVEMQRQLDTADRSPAALAPSPTFEHLSGNQFGGTDLDALGGNADLAPGLGHAPTHPSADIHALGGCGNNCCNYAWMSQLADCQSSFHKTQWKYYSIGWSRAYRTNSWITHDTVCAAVGTTHWTIQLGNSSLSMTVPQGNYYNAWWYNLSGGKLAYHRTNYQSAQALHSTCGGAS